jgi:hypothetical protein
MDNYVNYENSLDTNTLYTNGQSIMESTYSPILDTTDKIYLAICSAVIIGMLFTATKKSSLF